MRNSFGQDLRKISEEKSKLMEENNILSLRVKEQENQIQLLKAALDKERKPEIQISQVQPIFHEGQIKSKEKSEISGKKGLFGCFGSRSVPI